MKTKNKIKLTLNRIVLLSIVFIINILVMIIQIQLNSFQKDFLGLIQKRKNINICF